MKAPDLKQLSESRKLAFAALALILWNLGMFGFSLWQPLWQLAVDYDPFIKTSLLGRPWLIPQKLVSEGGLGVQALIAESHLLATLMRVFIGFILGAIPGIVIGVLMGMNRMVCVILIPFISRPEGITAPTACNCSGT